MRIGIDARFYGSMGKGLGRYTQKLIENLEKISIHGGPVSGQDHEYFIFLRKENFEEYELKGKNFKKIVADYRWYSLDEQTKFPRLLKKYKLDLVHFPHFNVPIFYFGKFIVTIHDLILIRFPTVRSSTLGPLFYWIKYFFYRIVIKAAVVRSNKIIAVSEFTKKDIQALYPAVPSEKIVVTYEACDDFCMFIPKKSERILLKYGILKPYVVYIGNVYPHKNPERLVRAFGKIEEEGSNLKLIFVGADDYFYLRLKQFVRDHKIGNVAFAGFVPDPELDVILSNAQAYVRPSLYEGFELPPLEAMAKGVPVISSRHSCALEILGDSAYYFDPKNIDAMAAAVQKVCANPDLRKELIKKGYHQVQRYSWKKMAQETLEIYERYKGKR